MGSLSHKLITDCTLKDGCVPGRVMFCVELTCLQSEWTLPTPSQLAFVERGWAEIVKKVAQTRPKRMCHRDGQVVALCF